MEKKKLVRQRISGRKKWAKPKLIVLVGGRSQEAVFQPSEFSVEEGCGVYGDVPWCGIPDGPPA